MTHRGKYRYNKARLKLSRLRPHGLSHLRIRPHRLRLNILSLFYARLLYSLKNYLLHFYIRPISKLAQIVNARVNYIVFAVIHTVSGR